jgi:hypothetical protein
LWVDCLCIVQDGDSIGHSLKAMAAIYASAELTIVAAAGEDANYGLRGVGGPSQARIIHNPNQTSHHRDGYPWRSKWATRGWTFQESLFSNRLLISDGLISWVCGCCMWLEERNTVSIKEVNEGPPKRSNLGVPVGMMGLLSPSLGRWGHFVDTFSGRTLTYERDSTKAFAGATELMSAIFPGGIFKGLPELYFDIALLWQPYETVSRIECKSHASEEALPSWSWTGWKGPLDCLFSWHPFKAGLYLNTGDYSDWVPIIELTPTAKWYKISTSSLQSFPVRNDFYKFQAFRNEVRDTLPSGWTRHQHPNGVYFTNQNSGPGRRYSYPLPVLDHLETNNNDDFGHIIRCIAPLALASFGKIKQDTSSILVELVSKTGKPIGYLRLHNIEELEGVRGGSCELIAISEGTVRP